MFRRVIFFVLVIFISKMVVSQEIKPSIEIFSDYTYDLTEGKRDLNSFNIKRAYFGVAGNFYKNEENKFSLNFKLTTDIIELSDIARKDNYQVKDNSVELLGAKSNGYYSEFLKYAFVEIENPFVNGLKLVIGQHNVPWVGYEEHMSGMRWLGHVFADRIKKLSSTDRGISLLYRFPSNFGDVHFSVVNGEGYHSPESTKDKDFMVRISLRPAPSINYLSGLILHGYYGYGRANIDGLNNDAEGVRKREILALSYDHKFITFMGQYLRTLDGKDTDNNNPVEGGGYGLWAKFKINHILNSNDTGIFVRYEIFDPDDKKDKDVTDLLVVAPYYYLVNDKLGFALKYQREGYQNPDVNTTNLIMLNMIGKY